MKLKKRRLMCDGSLVGAAVEGSLEIKGSEVYAIWNLLKKFGGSENGGLEVVVDAGSSMVVGLRPHYHNKDKWYLNLSGNALMFLKGSNVYGYAEADILITAAFVRALSMIGEFPRRVVKAIKNGDLNVHSIEFAAYTNEVPNKQQLINDWQTMYGTAYSNASGVESTTLCELLGLRYVKKNVANRNSVCLRVMTADGREEEAMLMAYDKAKLLRENELEVPVDIEKRLRLDLHLHHGWFRKKQINGRKLVTIKDLGEYVEKRHDGKWHKFIASEFERFLDRSCLFEMWRFDPSTVLAGTMKEGDKGFIKKLGPVVYTAMWLQRLNVRVTDEARLKAARGKHALLKKQQLPDPHPYPIKIDLSPLP